MVFGLFCGEVAGGLVSSTHSCGLYVKREDKVVLRVLVLGLVRGLDNDRTGQDEGQVFTISSSGGSSAQVCDSHENSV